MEKDTRPHHLGGDLVRLSPKLAYKSGGGVSVLRFYFVHLILCSYDYNMHFESLMSANLCLVTLLSLEQYLQLERFCLQHVQMVNKRSGFKTKLTGNIMSRRAGLIAIPFDV